MIDCWEIREFEDCLERIQYSNKIKKKQFQSEGDFPVISQEAKFINGYWDDADDVFSVTKPVVIFGDHTQVLKFVDFDFVLGADGVKILQPQDCLDAKFLFYYLNASPLKTLGYARHYRLLKELTVRFPPLPEQKHIVSILDQVFVGIATVTANAEKNLQNARELFESNLNSVFAERGEGWKEKKLGEVGKVNTGPFGSLLHKSDYVSVGVPLVNPINIIEGLIVPDSNKMVDDLAKSRLQNYLLSKGDIVIGRRGGIGRCAVVTDDQSGWICGTGCFFMTPSSGHNSLFLAWLIRSKPYRDQLEASATGATMKNISNKTLSNLQICIPSGLKQDEIVSTIESLQTQTQRLETIYQQKLANLAELKQSILQKAFSGELTRKAA